MALDYSSYFILAEEVEGSSTEFVIKHMTDPEQNIYVQMTVDEDYQIVEWDGDKSPLAILKELRF